MVCRVLFWLSLHAIFSTYISQGFDSGFSWPIVFLLIDLDFASYGEHVVVFSLHLEIGSFLRLSLKIEDCPLILHF